MLNLDDQVIVNNLLNIKSAYAQGGSMSDTFLPTGYEVPTTSNYMKFEEGENRFRVLGSPILGTEYWITKEDKKRAPKRLRMGIPVPQGEIEINPQTGEDDIPKHFWAMPVWNYAAKRIQILELTQSTIMKALRAYAANTKWGNPRDYDVIVTREKVGGKTQYSVMPDPKEEVGQEILEAYEKVHINLEALYDGADPFASQK